jgi:hypothetical protein
MPLALSRQGFPALIAATVQDFATIFGGHARTETVAAFANKVARLKSTFHIIAPARGRIEHPPAPRIQNWLNRREITGSQFVNTRK